MTMMNERLDDRMMEGNPADFFAGTINQEEQMQSLAPPNYNAIETPPLPPGFTGGMPPNVTYSGYSYGGTDPSYNANAHGRAMGMNPAGEMITESMIRKAPTFTTSAMNVNQTALPPMPPMQPAGEMLGERQLTPMDQTALPMQAQADLTRTATMGTPTPIVNPWDYNPIQHLYRSPFPTAPGTQGFLDWQDPYFQHRWNTGYKPFLNYLAGAMNPIHGAYNLYNQFIR